MASLDTNVLVRFLVYVNAAQFALAKRLIRKCVNSGQTPYVPVSVSLELEWVLRSNFGFAKDDVVQTLAQLLSAAELSFESEGALELALLLYKENSADYSDCVHVALVAQVGEQSLWTFDRTAAKLNGAKLLV